MDYVHDALEVARIIGEPKDPRKPYPRFIEAICFTDSADPNEYVYTYDVLDETDKVYLITASGEITQENVSPDTPSQLSFTDVASPEYWVKITELASAKEKTLARKNITINRAMNAYEAKMVIDLLAASCLSSGNQETLESGQTTFRYSNLINMLEGVIDFGDKFTLLVGTTVDKDIKLWDWTENKYHSLKQALADLNIDIVRVRMPLTTDGVSSTALAATKAYLVAVDTEIGKPIVFVRKSMNDIRNLPGVTTIAPESDGRPERLVFVGNNPMTVPAVSKRYVGVSLTGFGEIAAVVRNPYAIYEFERA